MGSLLKKSKPWPQSKLLASYPTLHPMHVVFFSTPSSGNTKRFVERLGFPATQIHPNEEPGDNLRDGFILITPTYNGNVPAPVVRFLNNPENRRHLRGVIGSGNINFGPEYAAAAYKISQKCDVPLLHLFELTGLPHDVEIVQNLITNK
jgi:protein involved in ribonucleotide reduction